MRSDDRMMTCNDCNRWPECFKAGGCLGPDIDREPVLSSFDRLTPQPRTFNAIWLLILGVALGLVLAYVLIRAHG